LKDQTANMIDFGVGGSKERLLFDLAQATALAAVIRMPS
jgi:hypothetical protein